MVQQDTKSFEEVTQALIPLALASGDRERRSSKTMSETSKKRKPSSSKSSSSPDDEKKKKKRPKRSLTPYNIFFRYERAKLLVTASEGGEGSSTTPPLCEQQFPPETDNSLMSDVRHLLANNPYEIDNRTRSHRKTHGKIGFQDMVRHISTKWKDADETTRDVFRKLSEEDKMRHAREWEEYNSTAPTSDEDDNKETDCERREKTKAAAAKKKKPRRKYAYKARAKARRPRIAEPKKLDDSAVAAPSSLEGSEVDAMDIIAEALKLADAPLSETCNNAMPFGMGMAAEVKNQPPFFAVRPAVYLPSCAGTAEYLLSLPCWGTTFPDGNSDDELEDSKLPVAADLVSFI